MGGGLNISLLFFGLSGISVVFPVIRVFPVNLGTAFAYSCSFTSHISYKNGMIGHGGWGWGGGGGGGGNGTCSRALVMGAYKVFNQNI